MYIYAPISLVCIKSKNGDCVESIHDTILHSYVILISVGKHASMTSQLHKAEYFFIKIGNDTSQMTTKNKSNCQASIQYNSSYSNILALQNQSLVPSAAEAILWD